MSQEALQRHNEIVDDVLTQRAAGTLSEDLDEALMDEGELLWYMMTSEEQAEAQTHVNEWRQEHPELDV